MHRSLVERVNGCADRVIIVIISIAIRHRGKSFLQRLDVAAFLAREFLPCWTLFSLRERRQDRVCFASRLNDLPLPEILFREVERLEQHVLDLFVGESVAGLDVDFSLLSAAL